MIWRSRREKALGLGFFVMCYFYSSYARKLAVRDFRVKRILRKDFRNLRLAIVAKNREIRKQRVHVIANTAQPLTFKPN